MNHVIEIVNSTTENMADSILQVLQNNGIRNVPGLDHALKNHIVLKTFNQNLNR